MSDHQQNIYARRRANLEQAMMRLAERLRILSVVGGLLILVGSLALTAAMLIQSISLIPIGILMIFGGLFEMGVGQHAAGDGPVTSWQISGGAHMAAGLVVLLAPFLPAMVFSTLLGALVLFAGITWLRLAISMPEAFQIPLLHVCGGFAGLVGLLILSRWQGDNHRLVALMLGCEILVRGWVWIGFAFSVSRKLGR